MRIPKTVRLLFELIVAVGLLAAAGFLGASSHLVWGVVVGLLALPLARLFGILVIDSVDLWMRRIDSR